MLNEFMIEKIKKIMDEVKANGSRPDVTVKRVGAS